MSNTFTLTPEFAASPFMPMVCLVTGRMNEGEDGAVVAEPAAQRALMPVRLRTIHAWMRPPGTAFNQVIDVPMMLPFSTAGYVWYRLSRQVFYLALLMAVLGLIGFRWYYMGKAVPAAWTALLGCLAGALTVFVTWLLLHFFVVPRFEPLAGGVVAITFPPRAGLAYHTLVQGYTRYRVSLGFETEVAEPPDAEEWSETGGKWDQGPGGAG